ncbi:hypothetical protein PENANT_c013G08421 [Penicillium antarcticum]|uniref:LysM domain-containing protein n=1 Tax=Penicillium antarcticum TaxID=416450 RepID=A0A1V6Q4V1_9EURO|nr:hypothetical protein PENANT_c013G08421 [Penicillium antarcticum]
MSIGVGFALLDLKEAWNGIEFAGRHLIIEKQLAEEIDRMLEDNWLPFIDKGMKLGRFSAAFLHPIVEKKNRTFYALRDTKSRASAFYFSLFPSFTSATLAFYPAPTDPILPSPTDIPSSYLPTTTTFIPQGRADPPGPTESGVPDTCNNWYILGNRDTCKSLSVQYEITEAKLNEYNPSVNAQRTNIRAGFAICGRVWEDSTARPAPSPPPTTTGPPSPTGTGASPTCTKWHLMVEDDSCDSFAGKYGILVARFRQLNRNVDGILQ